MELKEFIKETLTSIISGVAESQAYIREKNIECEVCPKIKSKYEETGCIFSDSGKPIRNVDFDVSVNVAEKVGSKGFIAITISQIGLGKEKNKENTSGQDSRIKFSIPITLPSMK
jgi:hypothetical protein